MRSIAKDLLGSGQSDCSALGKRIIEQVGGQQTQERGHGERRLLWLASERGSISAFLAALEGGSRAADFEM